MIVLLSFGTRFFNFNYPPEIVFDEVYFIEFSRDYFTGENYFDIHPPAGKLLLFSAAKIFGFNPKEGGFEKIGDSYGKKNLFAIRILPAAFSALFAALIYLLAFQITGLKSAGLAAGLLVVFENSLITN